MGRVASPYVPDDADRQLLRLLLAGGPVSGEEMSRELNMTRAAVWKRIAHLREMGYDIESAPRKGYWLAGDVLKADAVLAQLHTRVVRGACDHALEALGVHEMAAAAGC